MDNKGFVEKEQEELTSTAQRTEILGYCQIELSDSKFDEENKAESECSNKPANSPDDNYAASELICPTPNPTSETSKGKRNYSELTVEEQSKKTNVIRVKPADVGQSEGELIPPHDSTNPNDVNAQSSQLDIDEPPLYNEEFKSQVQISMPMDVVEDTRSHSITSNEMPICRICLGGSEEEELVRVCRCNGTLKLTHRSCVLTWFQESGCIACELCGHQMYIESTGWKSFTMWSCPRFDCYDGFGIFQFFAFYFVCLVIVTAILTVGTIQGCTSYHCIVFYTVCFAVIAITIYFCIKLDMCQTCKRKWTVINAMWVIHPYSDEPSQVVQQNGGVSLI